MGGRSSKHRGGVYSRGEANIVEALAVGLPDVFQAEILPRLELEDVLSLSRVNKSCWKAVWSEPGVRTMKAKVDSHLAKRTLHLRQLTALLFSGNAPHGSLPDGWNGVETIARHEEELQETWKKCISIKIGLVVWRHKHGHGPMVETLRRWADNGGPGAIERVLMSNWFQLSIIFACVIAVIWFELGFLRNLYEYASLSSTRLPSSTDQRLEC